MCAVQVSEMRSMSWMIAELAIDDDMSNRDLGLDEVVLGDIRNNAFAGARYESPSQLLHLRWAA